MPDAAIMTGSLVDVRNIGVHKSIKLTIHVPQELALQIFNSFGWPTMAEPVSVAIARLAVSDPAQCAPTKEVDHATSGVKPGNSPPPTEQAGDESEDPEPVQVVVKERTPWRDLEPTAQSVLRCKEPAFRAFIREQHNERAEDESECATAVRKICGVNSRSTLSSNHKARVLWHQLDSQFQAWARV